MYNIHNYITERNFEINMNLEGVMNTITGNVSVDLLPTKHKSISKIIEEPFYIGTNFTQIHSNLNSRFILISAPGATGKSALGKYIAYTRNAIYWNLADLSIGDGTFQGTLYRALGASNISDYAKKLQIGGATLVIDAFDEAEIISGRKNVEIFLQEANEFLEDSSSHSIILLSRTETAQNIATYFKREDIPYIHYEIGYFPDHKAKEFVLKTASKRKSITPAIETCVEEYFKQVCLLVHEQDTVNRFLGYAPVLEAIAAHITEISNTAKLLSDLQEGTSEVILIKGIMENLLEREQEKFVKAFKERLKDDEEKIKDWSLVYNSHEQLIRLLDYIILGKISYSDYFSNAIPEYLSDEYLETIELFLPQHPFIQNSFDGKHTDSSIDFAGPAFRDYSLANIILDKDYETSAELYYQRESATSHFPSELFWNHYIDINSNRIYSNHFAYLFEAYKSKTKVGYLAYLDVAQDDEGTYATLRVAKGNDIVDTTNLEVIIVNNELVFDSISNTSINVNCSVSIGQGDHVSIIDSAVFCKRLIINADTLSINAYYPSITTICCEESISKKHSRPLNIIVNASDEIQIDTPNIYDYPKLSRFKNSVLSADTLNIYVFIHYLRRIFTSFRTHKKDMPARDAEKIDFVIVGDNCLRKEIFNFLTQQEIVFREAHLYKVNLEKMSSFGISWGALTSTDAKQLNGIYERFCDWRRK